MSDGKNATFLGGMFAGAFTMFILLRILLGLMGSLPQQIADAHCASLGHPIAQFAPEGYRIVCYDKVEVK